ncbi:DUF3341 domain-containing protein [Komagataeibacter saccharivorans]|uniref:DUF3341 domain-containing protein n=1 Tax=Komagataeibacter saccharivorans TaxID=265959 RepID=UPI0039E98F3F
MIIAAFATEATLNDAATTLRREGACVVETYTGTQAGDNGGGSILPVLMLGGGVAGGMGGFGMQVYATTISYPLDVGGRPNLSWPSYIPATFELAVLGAVLAGIIGYFVTARLPRLYDPVDESAAMRDVMKGAHVLVVRSGDRARARQMLSRYEVLGIEEIGS